MSNKIKAVVLAALAVLAVNASAGSAAAEPAEFTSANYPATLTGTPSKEHVFMTKAGLLKCTTGNFGGTLTARSETILTAASYGNCTLGGAAAAVNMNGCTYLQSAGQSIETGKSLGGMNIECPATKAIVATSAGCEIKIPPAAEVGLNPYTNTGTGFKMGVSVEFGYSLNNKCAFPAGGYAGGILTGEYAVAGNNGLVSIAP